MSWFILKSRREFFRLLIVGLLVAPTLADEVRLGPNGPMVVKSESESEPEPYGSAAVRKRAGEARTSRIRIRSAPEPSPALKHVLVPGYSELKPGNAAPYYYRAIMRLNDVPKETIFEIQKLQELPVGNIDVQAADRSLAGLGPALLELNVATHREHCDWDWRIKERTGEQQVQFLLAEIQEIRTFGRILSLKAGSHLAKNEFDEAIQTLAMGYRMAKDVGEPAILINDLVAIAIASMMNERLVELIDLPNSPNMYWAIASLPRPLVSMRDGFQHERSLPYSFFPFLKNPENTELSKDEWRRVFEESLKPFVKSIGMVGNSEELLATPAALLTAAYPRAKRELIAAGFEKEKVESMPVPQVIAIHESRALRRISDNVFKWSLLPYHESEDKMKSQNVPSFDPFRENGESLPIASLLMPATMGAAQAEIRLHVELDGIRAMEALRMQMAADGGKLPAALEDVSVVPVPTNPATNKPFVYRPMLEESGRVLELIPGKNPPTSNIWQLELVPATELEQ